MFSNIRHILHFNVDYSEGASINDVRKNFGFFDPLPPLSANSHNLPLLTMRKVAYYVCF